MNYDTALSLQYQEYRIMYSYSSADVSSIPRLHVCLQVSRVSARVANVDIVGINGKASKEKFAGIVR